MPQSPIVVTGASSGMGKAAAMSLAKAGLPLVLILREGQKGRDAHAEIVQRSGNRAIEIEQADLSSQADIHRAAGNIVARHRQIAAFISNAGAQFNQRQLSVDGIEMTFAINQLAPFLLTHLFYDALKAHDSARIVVTASSLQFPFDLEDYNRERSYDGIRVYGQSKLANIQFTHMLAQRLTDTGITANCLAPGIVRTDLFRQTTGFTKFLFGALGTLFMDSPEKAARKITRLALDPALAETTGVYFAKDKPAKPIDSATEEEACQALWTLCERLTGLQP